MELAEIRKQLDIINKELVEVLARRTALIPKVADYKKEHDIPREQPLREQAIINSVRKLAEEKNVDPDLVEDLFRLIFEDAHRIEKDIIGE